MNIQKIINKNRKLTNMLLKYIGDENQSIDEYEQLRSFLDQNQIQQNYEKLRELLHIILNISNNHHRNINFFNKIEQIFKFLGNNIKQTFSNSEIYDFFSSNNSILLLLIKNSIIIIDESISALIQEENSKGKNFYFFPEIKPFINHSKSDEIEKEMHESFPNIEDFFRLRKKGENEHYICELIRNDSIEEFVKYVNQTNYSISSTIQYSIFEMNAFLVERKKQH